MAVTQFHNPRRVVMGVFPMPNKRFRAFKGHSVSEVTRKWELAWDAMQSMRLRKAARLYVNF